jgi:hypothetical protein
MRHEFHSFIGLAMALAAVASPAAAEVRVRHLISPGQPAPGIPEATLVNLTAPTIFPAVDLRGQTLASAFLTGPGVTDTNNSAAWLVDVNRSTLLFREGDTIPGLPTDVSISVWRMIGISDDSTAFLTLNLRGNVGGTTDSLLARVRPGDSLHVLAREGEPVPFRPNLVWGDWGRALGAVTPDGDLVFRTLSSGPAVAAIADAAGISPVYVEGDPLDDLPGATATGGFVAVASAGRAALLSMMLSGPGIDTTNDSAIFEFRDAALHLRLREGSPAADLPGVLYRNFNYQVPVVAIRRPQWVIPTTLSGDGVVPTNNEAFFLIADGEVSLLTREGDPAPGTPGGVLANPIWYQPHRDGVVFHATDAASGWDAGLWLATPDGVARIVHEGDPAPDHDPMFVFVNFRPFGNYSPIRINDAGRLAFQGLINDPLDDTNSIYGTDPLGRLRRGVAVLDQVATPIGVRTLGSFLGATMAEDGGLVVLATLSAPSPGNALIRLDVGCPGSGCDDLDIGAQDCVVDLADLARLLIDFGGGNEAGDVNRDGDVDLADLSLMLTAFGRDCRGL